MKKITFDCIFCELENIEWTEDDTQCDTITVYDNGEVLLLNEHGYGSVLAGKASVRIFHLPDEVIDILMVEGKFSVNDENVVLTGKSQFEV